MGLAQQAVAINDFLKPIVSKIAADPNAGGWTWEMNGNGGYLLRLEMDVTGDGRPEHFVTTSLTAVKDTAEWAVFDVSETGVMSPYAALVRLMANSVWPTAQQDAPALLYVAPPNRERQRTNEDAVNPVYRFTFKFPGIQKTFRYASDDEVAKLRPPSQSLPKLQAILLADYLTQSEARWKEVTEWALDAYDCFFRSEDKERAAKNTAFTPQAALSHLGVVQKDIFPARSPSNP